MCYSDEVGCIIFLNIYHTSCGTIKRPFYTDIKLSTAPCTAFPVGELDPLSLSTAVAARLALTSH